MNKPLNIVNFYLNKELLKNNYEQFSNIGQIYYPLKTNSNEILIKELIKLFENSDNGFLISHLSHYEQLTNLGVNPDRMCMANVIIDDNFIEFLYKKGIRYFTFDNINSLSKFLLYADVQSIKIAIRLNIFEVFGVYSHLGATCEECKQMISILKEKNVKNYGLSFYLQKETLPQKNVLHQMLDYIETNFKNLTMPFINIGGAIKPKNIDLNRLEKLKKTLGSENIIVEPGRYLVGNAGYMETQVVKQKSENIFILKNGIYSGLVDVLLYNKKFELYLKVLDNLIPLKSEKFKDSKEVIFYGASSDSGDKLGKFYIDNKYYNNIKIDSTIIINNALAYVEEFFMPLGGDFIKKYHIIN